MSGTSYPPQQDVKERVDGYLLRKQEHLVEILNRLIAFPTVNPPGRNCRAAQEWVADRLRQSGAVVDSWDVYPGDPNVMAVFRGSDPERYHSLILNGHMDVAPVSPDEPWTGHPFAPRREGGRIYGRGASDMKGGLASILYALEALTDCKVHLPGDLIVQSVVGEEMGEPGTLSCLERGYRADMAVIPEPTGLSALGQGGAITGWIIIHSPETYHDAQRSAMIHAGGGLHAASAIDKMVKIIAGLHELERHWAVVKSHPDFPPGTSTINPAYIEGGRHPAFIADRCSLWVTVHFYPGEDYRSVVREVEDFVLRLAAADPWLKDHPPVFRWGGRSMNEDKGEIFPAAPLPVHDGGFIALAAAHESITGSPMASGMSRGVSDTGWFADAGIPCVAYGPGTPGQAHTVDESIDEQDLLTASRVFARLALDWCATPKPAGNSGTQAGEGGR